MGFSGNGMVSIRNNHSMLSKRGGRFYVDRNYINAEGSNGIVDEDRMQRVADKARLSLYFKVSVVILIVTILLISLSL